MPGRVVHFHHRCVAGAVPPKLGTLNPYGGEGPKSLDTGTARRAAATTPPSLGCMNPYGGEGPPGQASASASAWWMNFQRMQDWIDAYGFPKQTAKPRSEEQRLAQWWNHNTKAERFAKLDPEQQSAIDRMRVHANAAPVVSSTLADWHSECDKLEQWISEHDNQLPKQHSDAVAHKLALWLTHEKSKLKQLSGEQQLRLAPILQKQVRVKTEEIAEVPVCLLYTSPSPRDRG